MTATASVTRSRRAEGLHLASRLLANSMDQYAPRPKRQLDPSERDLDNIVPKKARFTTGIAVEIPARPSSQTRLAKNNPDAKPTVPKPAVAAAADAPKAPSHRAPPANGRKPAPASAQQQPTLTKHQEKVANGLKHELDRLQPNAADTKDVGRKLRSQEATRFKSELSAYFPEYDQIMGNEPKETHLLNPDTPIIVNLSDPALPESSSSSSLPQQPPHPTSTTTTTAYPIRSYSDALFTDLHDAQRIDFSFLTNNNKQHHQHHPPQPPPPAHSTRTSTSTKPPAANTANDDDPLPDTLYLPLHKREARQERSIRNTEKGRAQHERDQIARLLDGLLGHDWLRVMGVSGITESKKRAFEPAREYFIRGCEGILEKFRRWAAEERRRRLEGRGKDKGKMKGGRGRGGEEEGEGTEGEAVAEEEGEEGSEKEEEEEEDEEVEEKETKRRRAQDEPPDEISDVEASVAKQLREEALAAAANRTTYKSGRRPPTRIKLRRPNPEDRPPPDENTSSFAQADQNNVPFSEGRGGRGRRRKALAWGQPLPVLKQRDFALPAEVFEREKERGAAAGKTRRSRRVRK